MKCDPYRNLSASVWEDSLPTQQETNNDGATNTSPNKRIGKPAIVSRGGWLVPLWLELVAFGYGMSRSKAGGQNFLPQKTQSASSNQAQGQQRIEAQD